MGLKLVHPEEAWLGLIKLWVRPIEECLTALLASLYIIVMPHVIMLSFPICNSLKGKKKQKQLEVGYVSYYLVTRKNYADGAASPLSNSF